MAPRSMTAEVMSSIEAITPEVRALYVAAGSNHIMSFEIVIGELARLESLCEARAEKSAYESHRRALEACHVATVLPEARRG
jgi:hypothetical protein